MKQFWKEALERALKTAAQTAVAAIGTTAAIDGINWAAVAYTVAIATGLSLLTSIASRQITGEDSPSLVKDEGVSDNEN